VTCCRICGSTALVDVPFGYLYEEKWLGGRKCRECGMIFLDPQPGPEDISRMYAKEYFEGDFRCGHEGSYFDDATLGNLVDLALLERILAHASGNRFLEIGCAGGAFLNAARSAGLQVTGVEYSPDAAAFARDHFGLDVRVGDLESAGFPPSSFDAVFMGDVLEHLPDPLATLREIRQILSPGGVLIVLCPTQTNTLYSRLGFFVYGLLGRKVTVHLPPYHLFEYRPASLSRMMVRAGFDIARCTSTLIPPGSINLRGDALQKFLKKAFQYPNLMLTNLTGCCGDRIELIVRVPGRSPA
jgi:SAM-dependent methyltransferase